LPREGLNMRAWEGHEAASFEKVENRQAEQWRDDADVTSPVEAVA